MSSSSSLSYEAIRAAVQDGGGTGNGGGGGAVVEEERVEVNQRALIDKILARYASAGAVYRELLQNSNDAEAQVAEIRFSTTTKQDSGDNNKKPVLVTQVAYRNNGLPFAKQDWQRLRKIAEGNPHPTKVGAFGVGAYTMFSIAENPMVISGGHALAFVWKGDALWTQTTRLAEANAKADDPWTTFVLPSRDPYPLPDWVEFGQFLAAALTFTQCLHTVSVFLNEEPLLCIHKALVQKPRLVTAPPAPKTATTNTANASNNSSNNNNNSWTSWFGGSLTSNNTASSSSKNHNKLFTTPRQLFYLPAAAADDNAKQSQSQQPAIWESIYEIAVTLFGSPEDGTRNDAATIRARHVTAQAQTQLPPDMVQRMHRVTKKNPPPTVPLQIYLDTTVETAEDHKDPSSSSSSSSRLGLLSKKKTTKKKTPAQRIAASFKPVMGGGRIFIGFRTSQTTGVAAHVAAPFLPTVEREAMDLQDATLSVYNAELLHLAGTVLRLTLQHAFLLLQYEWHATAATRRALQSQSALSVEPSEEEEEEEGSGEDDETKQADQEEDATSSTNKSGFMGFARFMARGVSKKLTRVVTTVMEEVKTVSTSSNANSIDYNALVQAAPDPRPLCAPERAAIQLMQALCPQPSTPDPAVGAYLAQGFDHAHAAPAPCLTLDGVVPATQARLPAHGMEAFCQAPPEEDDEDEKEENKEDPKAGAPAGSTKTTAGPLVVPKKNPSSSNSSSESALRPAVVRHVIWEQTQDYHAVICANHCRPLELERDLLPYFRATVLTQATAMRLVQWWKPYSRILGAQLLQELRQQQAQRHHSHSSYNPSYHHNPSDAALQLVHSKGVALKESICFAVDDKDKDAEKVIQLKDYLFFLDKDSPLGKYVLVQQVAKPDKHPALPLPETVLPVPVHEWMGGATTLQDAMFANVWFQPLPMELWAEFVAHHDVLRHGLAQHDRHRLAVWTLLHAEYQRRSRFAQTQFVGLLKTLLSQVPCLPYDAPHTQNQPANDNPKESQVTSQQATTASTTNTITIAKPAAAATTKSVSSNASVKTPSQDGPRLQQKALVDVPSALYLYSAELEAFEGVSSSHCFFKVSQRLMDAGITEAFLLALGVRQSVSIDFLFANLDTLRWNHNPRPLIEYLKSAKLTPDDLHKLRTTQYLPAAAATTKDDTTTKEVTQKSETQQNYAPSELYLPREDLRIFPFLKLLQWPTETEVSERSENGRFLVQQLGVKVLPGLVQVLQYACRSDLETTHRLQVLDFLASQLSPSSDNNYRTAYARWSNVERKRYKFVPCTALRPLRLPSAEATKSPKTPAEGEEGQLLAAPPLCFSDAQCAVMGFTILAEEVLGGPERCDFYASVFQCPQQPEPTALVHQLINLVATAQRQQQQHAGDMLVAMEDQILSVFAATFKYLSHRSSDFSATLLASLKTKAFIPCRVEDTKRVEWFGVDQVFFRKEKDGGESAAGTEELLFQVVDFSPFLAAAGVKQNATTAELFARVLENPKSVLQALGGSEPKYRALLRRIAADPPFASVTDKIRQAPFLLAYQLQYNHDDDEKKQDNKNGEAAPPPTFDLAAAPSIYIIDNSFFGRMFPVPRAPPETDLEDFYVRLGAPYISKSVQRRFEVVGPAVPETMTTRKLAQRVAERAPLLVSPHITTRPLVAHAAQVLKSLEFAQASGLLAVYSLAGTTRRSATTCFARRQGGGGGMLRGKAQQQNVLYVVPEFDWFDVGHAIGDLILQRCQLEDAFFISSLLDAPLEQLRARGFPVDRLLHQAVAPAVATKKPAVAHAVNQPSGKPPVVWNPDGSIAKDINLQDQSSAAKKPAPQAPAASAGPKAPPPPPMAPSSAAAAASKGKEPSSAPPAAGQGGFEEILFQMFPDADPNFVKAALGPNPSLDTVRSLAEEMAAGRYPKRGQGDADDDDDDDDSTVQTDADSMVEETASVASSAAQQKKKKKGGRFRNKLGKAFSGLRGSSTGSGLGAAGMPPQQQQQQQRHHESVEPVAPAEDAHSQQTLERTLQDTIKDCTHVGRHGVETPETVLTSDHLAETHRGETCEVIDSQSLQPFGRTKRAKFLLLASTRVPHATLLLQQDEVVESFALVLQQLATRVFGIRSMDSIAIFNEPVGHVIAFNQNRALHFNLRFYHALHFLTGHAFSRKCYSYWFVIVAHELAHNLVGPHNREHGYYTESFCTQYLPQLMELLASLPPE